MKPVTQILLQMEEKREEKGRALKLSGGYLLFPVYLCERCYRPFVSFLAAEHQKRGRQKGEYRLWGA